MSSLEEGVPAEPSEQATAEYFGNARSPSLEGYRNMLDDTFGLDGLSDKYIYLSGNLISEFERSSFWQSFVSGLNDLNVRHYKDYRVNLLAVSGVVPPEVIAKPFDSVLEKTYRQNYRNNLNFPKPPDGGWVDHTNWYTKLRDIIRTTVVVKYLDGVTAVSELVENVCANATIKSDVSEEARDSGYYAMHNVVCVPLLMPTVRWEVLSVDIPVEIQVATQVQDVIRKLTHTFYKERRMRSSDPESKWQWNWDSPEFVPNYLGHILHYVDGTIMGIRSKEACRQRKAAEESSDES